MSVCLSPYLSLTMTRGGNGFSFSPTLSSHHLFSSLFPTLLLCYSYFVCLMTPFLDYYALVYPSSDI